ncbi:MAG: hypothetical protein WCG42_02765 [Parachlamydiaceae bacterium]
MNDLSLRVGANVTLAAQPAEAYALTEHHNIQTIKDVVVKVIQEIVADSERRIQNCKKDLSLLSNGCFYPNGYSEILKENGLDDRLKALLDKGNLFHGYAASTHFKMKEDHKSITGIKVNLQVLKEGVTPSEGLKAIREGLSLIRSGEACQIAYYEAIRSRLGDDKFNELFAAPTVEGVRSRLGDDKFNELFLATSATPLNIEAIRSRLGDEKLNELFPTPLSIQWDSVDNPLVPFFILSCHIEFSKGDMFNLQNIPYYKSKHVNGECGEFNVICTDNTKGHETFTTLGLKSKGSTGREIQDQLFHEFNKKPITIFSILPKETIRPFLDSYGRERWRSIKKLEDLQFGREEFLRILRENGGCVALKQEFNAGRVEELAALSIPAAITKFASWNIKKWIWIV